jgi:hypothetical protein
VLRFKAGTSDGGHVDVLDDADPADVMDVGAVDTSGTGWPKGDGTGAGGTAPT